MERDYSKFLRRTEDGPRLNTRLIPRPVYVEMVKRYRRRPEVIDAVAEEQFWLWDLNERERKAVEAGHQVSRADLAEEIESEMEDREWWATTAAFEEHLMAHFADNPAEWADLLDPVYDEQELEGWRRLQ